jgi:diaminohydroxyphosphoribosylaminopyrimidine deaminase/5-amino-6-(5-phosphoribosylamino)uracil reductase
MSSEQDTRFMQRAIELARKGWGTTHPNPMVGAVIVDHSKVVGEGYHAQAGSDHAEIVALKSVTSS